MNAAKRTEIFRRLRAANPAPTTELAYGTPFELLISVMLSAQATDKSVNLATERLFPLANTPRKILALGESGLTPYIQRIGLFRSKSNNVIATCALLMEKFCCEVPQNREDLVRLPGVGTENAKVLLITALG